MQYRHELWNHPWLLSGLGLLKVIVLFSTNNGIIGYHCIIIIGGQCSIFSKLLTQIYDWLRCFRFFGRRKQKSLGLFNKKQQKHRGIVWMQQYRMMEGILLYIWLHRPSGIGEWIHTTGSEGKGSWTETRVLLIWNLLLDMVLGYFFFWGGIMHLRAYKWITWRGDVFFIVFGVVHWTKLMEWNGRVGWCISEKWRDVMSETFSWSSI